MAKKREGSEVREPVQVYLAGEDRDLLERAALAMSLPKAEVLRRGLRRVALEILADESPALAFLGRADAAPPGAPDDVAARHDEYLADWEMAAWAEVPPSLGAARPAKAKRRK